jgi:ubiquinone/menaquinone biosynthesis C-methylase UbiE
VIKLIIYPEKFIIESLLNYLTFNDKFVLEIGCGAGRITFELARVTKRIVAIDNLAEKVEKAIEVYNSKSNSKVDFQVTGGETLPFLNCTFDIVFYSGSLCCITSANGIEESLNESWRILNTGGFLINLQPAQNTNSLSLIKKINQKESRFVTIVEKELFIKNCWWISNKSSLIILQKCLI